MGWPTRRGSRSSEAGRPASSRRSGPPRPARGASSSSRPRRARAQDPRLGRRAVQRAPDGGGARAFRVVRAAPRRGRFLARVPLAAQREFFEELLGGGCARGREREAVPADESGEGRARRARGARRSRRAPRSGRAFACARSGGRQAAGSRSGWPGDRRSRRRASSSPRAGSPSSRAARTAGVSRGRGARPHARADVSRARPADGRRARPPRARRRLRERARHGDVRRHPATGPRPRAGSCSRTGAGAAQSVLDVAHVVERAARHGARAEVTVCFEEERRGKEEKISAKRREREEEKISSSGPVRQGPSVRATSVSAPAASSMERPTDASAVAAVWDEALRLGGVSSGGASLSSFLRKSSSSSSFSSHSCSSSSFSRPPDRADPRDERRRGSAARAAAPRRAAAGREGARGVSAPGHGDRGVPDRRGHRRRSRAGRGRPREREEQGRPGACGSRERCSTRSGRSAASTSSGSGAWAGRRASRRRGGDDTLTPEKAGETRIQSPPSEVSHGRHDPSFAPGHFLVELDGAPAGYARNVEGGGAHADVIQVCPAPGTPSTSTSGRRTTTTSVCVRRRLVEGLL